MTGKIFLFFERNPATILIVSWIIAQSVIFYFSGIQSTGESLKYIGQAYHIVHDHHVDEMRYVFYIIPVLLIALIQWLHLPLVFYIFFQLALNAIATIAFYKIARQLFQNISFAFIAAFLFITFIPYQCWNFFYYTDSFFYSISILFFYAMIVLNDEKRKTHILRLLLLLILIFTRPLGILYILPFAVFYLMIWKQKLRIKILSAIIPLFISITAINFLYKGGGDMNILFPQTEGYVICFQHSIITPNAVSIGISGNPVKDISTYILQNPQRFFELAMLRLISFFNLCRPYYSLLHNFYLAAYLIFFYGCAFFSFVKISLFKTKAVKYFIVFIFIVFVSGVMLQCNDFNSRFVMPLFPLIILFAVDFWNKIFGKKLNGKL